VRVVAIFPGALGDVVLLGSAVARLCARGATVELSVQRRLADVVATLLPNVGVGPPVDGTVMTSLFADALRPELRAWLHGADRGAAGLARRDFG
jgi:hypothetical protein